MSIKSFALTTFAALSLGAMVAIPTVSAQSTSWVEVRNDAALAAWNTTAGMTANKSVLGPNGAEIGRVGRILGADRNSPAVAVVDFTGVEGYRQGRTAVPLEQFTLADGILSLRSSASELAAMPAWNS